MHLKKISQFPLKLSIILHPFPTTVEIAAKNGNVQFLGFLMQARRVDTGTPVGTFIPPADGGAKGLTCSNVNDSITHTDKSVKFPSYFLEWKAPSSLVGDIEFL